jgi:hypothetical protein
MPDLHFLNGDALLPKFPLKGEVRVMREAMIDGPLLPDLDPEQEHAFEALRARYHAADQAGSSDEETPEGYRSRVAAEWKALRATDAGRVYFWFDADAFCQLNQVFLLAFLAQNPESTQGKSFFYIRPQAEEFRAMQGGDFAACLNDAMPISQDLIQQANRVWKAVAEQDFDALGYAIDKLPGNHFALKRALRWYADNFRPEAATGLPRLVGELRRWRAALPGLEPMSAAEAFRLFSNRYKPAGLGDVQFFKLWNLAAAR